MPSGGARFTLWVVFSVVTSISAATYAGGPAGADDLFHLLAGPGTEPGPRSVELDRDTDGDLDLQDAAAWQRGEGVGRSAAGSPPPALPKSRLAAASADSQPVTLGELITAAIDPFSDVDVYEFTLDAPRTLFIDVTTSSAAALIGELVDEYDRTIVSGNGNLTDLGPVDVQAGVYRFIVFSERRGVGDYTVRISDATPEQATLPFGAFITGEIPVPNTGQQDIYTFTAERGEQFFLDHRSASHFVFVRYSLEDRRGTTVFATGNARDVGPIELLGGDYRLVVSAAGDHTSTYEFVAFLEPTTREEIVLGTPVAHNFARPGERRTYAFTLEEPQRVLFHVTEASNNQAVQAIIRNAADIVLAETQTFFGTLPVLDLPAGDYTIELTANDRAPTDVTFVLAQPTESRSTARIGDTINGELVTPGSSHAYTFTLSTPRSISIDQLASSNSFGMFFELRDSADQVVASTVDRLRDFAPDPLSPGAYTLVVASDRGGIGTYEFALVDAGPVNFTPSGQAIPRNEEIVGEITNPGGRLDYLLTLASSATLYFDKLDNSEQLEWFLQDAAGVERFRRNANSPSSADAGAFALPAGTYQLSFNATAASATPTFAFRVISIADPVFALELGEAASGSFSDAPLATHRYAFTATTEGRPYFVLTNLTAALDAAIHDAAGNRLLTQRVSPNNAQLGPLHLPTGQHELRLTPLGLDEPEYVLSSYLVPMDPAPIDLDEVVSGDFADQPGGTRRFTFSLADDTEVYIDRLTPSSSLRWSLFDATGRALFENAAANTVNSDQGPLGLVAGVYVLELDAERANPTAFDFVVRAVNERSIPIALDQVVSAGELSAFGRTRLNFPLVEGQKVAVTVTGADPDASLTLNDPVGTAVFTTEEITPGLANEPTRLRAGTYELIVSGLANEAPQGELVVENLATNLVIKAFSASQQFFPADTTNRRVALEWHGANVGGGPKLPGRWQDHIIFSLDDELGNADDVLLASIAGPAGLSPDASYRREQVVALPDNWNTEAAYLFLLVDAGDKVFEQRGEANNQAALKLQIIADPADTAGSVATVATLPFEELVLTTARPQVDIALDGTVDLNDTRFVLLEAITFALEQTEFAGSFAGAEAAVRFILLDGDQEVLVVEEEPAFTTTSSVLSVAARFSRVLTASEVALLPSTRVNGIRIAADISRGTDLIIRPTYADQRVRAHFTACEFQPCGPHERRELVDVAPIELQTGLSDWDTYLFESPVPGDDLALVDGPQFNGENRGFIIGPRSTSQVQLILDDGNFLTLDDSEAPSTLGQPTTSLATDHSLRLPPDALAGRTITGFRWRVSATGGLSPFVRYEPRTPFAINFLYDLSACRGELSIPLADISPANGATLEAGTAVVISGRVLPVGSGRQVQGVLVNGAPADEIDAANRFFHTVTVAEGRNDVVLTALEPGCGETQQLVSFTGSSTDTLTLADLVVSDALLEVEYLSSTFNRQQGTLFVDARVRNVGDQPVQAPILMLIGTQLDPTVHVQAPDGTTADGRPFLTMFPSGTLEPGATGPVVTIGFVNPNRVPVNFEVNWLSPPAAELRFQTIPPTRTVAGDRYDYTPAMTGGAAVQFRLVAGPAAMRADERSGTITWEPGANDLGTHEVLLAATDASGQEATQQYTLTVAAGGPNRAPRFNSVPATRASIGRAYEYAASATDPDRDPLEYALLDAPADLVIDPVSGLLSWEFPLPGVFPVSIQVRDGQGGSATQAFDLTVGTLSSNPGVPQILGIAPTTAVAGQRLVYQPVVFDPDGDSLSFMLSDAPVGMEMDAATGRLDWTPAPAQVGSVEVSWLVTDGRGGVAQQSLVLSVRASADDLAPVFESTPPTFVLRDAGFRYDALARDPEGQPITYAVVTGPPGLTIDASTGVVTWPSGDHETGLALVALSAIDSAGNQGSQVFRLDVRAGNGDPAFESPPRLEVTSGTTYQYDANATDPDGDLLRYQLEEAPSGMTIDAITGVITWPVTIDAVGEHLVTVRVTDCCGGVATQEYVLTVLQDVEPPEVLIGFSTQPAPVGEPITVAVVSTDNIGIERRTLRVTCGDGPVDVIELDEIGGGTFIGRESGICAFEAEVVDRSGNLTTATARLFVGDPTGLDPHPPVVTVLSPQPDSDITAPTEIVASISDATPPGQPGSELQWRVEIARGNSDNFEQLGSGSGPIESGVLAELDPTMRPNDSYTIRIACDDGVQTAISQFHYHIAGDMKLGNFTTSTVDLNLPVAGIPLVLIREYDSLDTTSGDFGPGWRLRLPGEIRDTPSETLGEPLTLGSRVYVTDPAGNRVAFDVEVEPLAALFPFIVFVEFTPDGHAGTLKLAGDNVAFISDGALFDGLFNEPFNPATYVYESAEGVAYTIDEQAGLQRIEDRNGNFIDVTPEGLISSTGIAVAFERNAAGAITRITEPGEPGDPGSAPALEYDYDPITGSLTAFRDQQGRETRYFYADPRFTHYLTRIEDPRGFSTVRTVYDEDGRVVAQCDANGDPQTLAGCLVFSADAAARIQTVIDTRGNRVDLIFDEDGNLTIERRWLEDGTFLDAQRTYDERGNVIAYVNPEGEVWISTYDARGNRTNLTDPAGNTWTTTWNDCNQPVERCDPLGNCTYYTYDANCNTRTVTDALGNVTEYEYTPIGQISRIIEPTGSVWQFHYDEQEIPTGFTDPAGNREFRRYALNGQLRELIDRNGERITFEYDDSHRVTREIWHLDTGARVFEFQYNAEGRIELATDSAGATVQVDYDNVGRIAAVSNAGTTGVTPVSFAYAYDGVGNVTRVSDSLGGVTEYEYNAFNSVVSVRQSGVGVNPKRVDVTYNASQTPAEIRRYADLAGTEPVANTLIDYDCSGCTSKLNLIEHRNARTGATLRKLQLTRDAAGFVTAVADSDGSRRVVSDALGRLITIADADQPDDIVEFYRYDAVGNRRESQRSAQYTHGYDRAACETDAICGNQLLADDQFEYEYDNEGKLTLQRNKVSGQELVLEYDPRDRLTAATLRDVTGGVLTQVAYRYDPANRRITRAQDGIVTQYHYDQDNPVLKLSPELSEPVRRLYGRAADGIVADQHEGVTRWMLVDHMYSVRDLVANDGSVIASYSYDAFGNVVTQSDPTVSNELRFNARPFDAATGLGDYRARWYDPHIGRFIAPDPLDPYRYDYAANNPLVLRDPSGMSPATEHCIMSQFSVYLAKMTSLSALAVYELSFGPINASLSITGLFNTTRRLANVDIVHLVIRWDTNGCFKGTGKVRYRWVKPKYRPRPPSAPGPNNTPPASSTWPGTGSGRGGAAPTWPGF